ncbi:YjiH family protein, partial [Halobium palmae]
MFDSAPWESADQRTWNEGSTEREATTVDDADLPGFELVPALRFSFAFLLGVFFFLVPITWEGQLTVPFDVAASWVTATFPRAVGAVGLAVVTAGGLL